MPVNVGLPMFPMIQFDMPLEQVKNYYISCGYNVDGITIIPPADKAGEEMELIMWLTGTTFETNLIVEDVDSGEIRYRFPE